MAHLTGEHVSTDAMFRLGGRIKGGEYKCYVFAMGERHNICRVWGLDGDTDESLLPGLELWAKQLKEQVYYDRDLKKDVNALNAVKWWHDDRCCRGNGNVRDHPYMAYFPNLTRVRIPDLAVFCSCSRLTPSCVLPFHLRHELLRRHTRTASTQSTLS